MQILRREVRAEIGAMAPDRAVVHEAVLEEDLLARGHVLAREEDGAGRVDDPRGNWRRLAVGLDGQPDQNRKAEHHRDDGGDLPPDQRGPLAGACAAVMRQLSPCLSKTIAALQLVLVMPLASGARRDRNFQACAPAMEPWVARLNALVSLGRWNAALEANEVALRRADQHSFIVACWPSSGMMM